METNGIVSLSNLEIERVSGGKSVLDRYWDSLASWLDGLSGPPGPMSLSLSSDEIADLTRICEDSGANLSFSGSLADGGVNIRLTSGDGTYTWINVPSFRP